MKQFGLAFGLVGLGFLIAASWLFIDHQQFMSVSKKADAVVVRIDLVKGDEGDSYIPVFEFKTEKGESIITHPNITLSPPYDKNDFTLGQKITIRYDPTDPKKIYLLSFFENWGLILIFGGLGIITLAIGIGALMTHRRNPEPWKKEAE